MSELVFSIIDAILSILAILSTTGALIFSLYLLSTLRSAPLFSKSIERQRAGKKNGPQSLPLVSVIITARNEEETIARCVSTLTKQTYANLEFIVVDDSSSDKTKKIAESFSGIDKRVRVVETGSKPSGWVGKSWPCWRGYESAKGELMLFVDADSTFEPSVIDSAVNYLLENGYDVFSISPKVNLKGIWACSTIPLVSTAIDILYPLVKVNDPRSQRAYVYGTFILIKKKAYEGIGGHREVRDLIVEDAALARRAKSSGFRLRVERGVELFSTEWEHELRRIYSGLERVTSSSIRSYGLVAILNAVLIFFIAIYPILFIAGVIWAYFSFSSVSGVVLLGLVSSLLDVVFMMLITGIEITLVARRLGFIPAPYPIGVLIFISAIITTSFKVSKGRTIEWSGSTYVQRGIDKPGVSQT